MTGAAAPVPPPAARPRPTRSASAASRGSGSCSPWSSSPRSSSSALPRRRRRGADQRPAPQPRPAALAGRLADAGGDDPAAGDHGTAAEETTSQEPETFDINEDDYLGRDVADVEAELKSLGLKPTSEEVDNDGTQEEDTVASVEPHLRACRRATQVVVQYYGAPVETSGPPETPPGQEKQDEEDQQ